MTFSRSKNLLALAGSGLMSFLGMLCSLVTLVTLAPIVGINPYIIICQIAAYYPVFIASLI